MSTAKMPVHFLDYLPTEIRIQIYAEILSSTTGYVSIDSSTLEETGHFSFLEYEPSTKQVREDPISLSLLRTCKKIYSECSDLFWRQNTLALNQRELFLYGLERTCHRRLLNRVQRVYLNLDLSKRQELYWTRLSLSEIGVWAVEGMLKSIVLNITDDWQELARLLQVRRSSEPRGDFFGLPNHIAGDLLFHEYMDVFREAAQGTLSNVERKIPLEAGIMRWPLEPSDAGLKKLVGTYNELCGLLDDLHEAWGG